jgi:hypothetical protein
MYKRFTLTQAYRNYYNSHHKFINPCNSKLWITNFNIVAQHDGCIYGLLESRDVYYPTIIDMPKMTSYTYDLVQRSMMRPVSIISTHIDYTATNMCASKFFNTAISVAGSYDHNNLIYKFNINDININQRFLNHHYLSDTHVLTHFVQLRRDTKYYDSLFNRNNSYCNGNYYVSEYYLHEHIVSTYAIKLLDVEESIRAGAVAHAFDKVKKNYISAITDVTNVIVFDYNLHINLFFLNILLKSYPDLTIGLLTQDWALDNNNAVTYFDVLTSEQLVRLYNYDNYYND